MEKFAALCALFLLGSMLGWVTELLFRRAVHGKWVNPGFLNGPWLPLYGSGILGLYALCSLKLPEAFSPAAALAVRIVLIAVAMTGIEYVTGLIFTRCFRVRLWDYSTRPGNIDGIICPLFSLIWAVAGAAYALLLHEPLTHFVQWLGAHPLVHFLTGILLGVWLVDVWDSFRLAAKLRALAKERRLQIRYESLKLSMWKSAKENRLRRHFLLPLHTSGSLRADVERYLAELKEKSPRRKKRRGE